MNPYEYPDFWFPGDVEIEAYVDGGLHRYRGFDSTDSKALAESKKPLFGAIVPVLIRIIGWMTSTPVYPRLADGRRGISWEDRPFF